MKALDSSDSHVLHELSTIAANATSLNAADRDQAERRVKHYQDLVDQQTGFVNALLQISCSDLPGAAFCSIVLKNTLKQCWNPATAEHCIQEVDKAVVRDNIVHCMLHASPAVQRNIAEAAALIADIDFPLAWPNALDLIVHTLSSADASVEVRCAALSTAHSILGKYRTQGSMSESFVTELRVIYSTLLRPLLQSMELLLDICERTPGRQARGACRGVISTVECLLDMTSLDLGDEFIWSMETIVGLFLRCLRLHEGGAVLSSDHASAGAGAGGAEHRGSGVAGVPAGAREMMDVVVELKSVVTSCVTHFLSEFDEDFEKYAHQFLDVVWGMLANPASLDPAMDELVIRGLELLSSACRGTSRPVFDSDDFLRNLVHHVILPNLQLQESDLENYSSEPEAYVQRDIEGSDLHTRRRVAGELLRSLMVSVPERTRPLLTSELNRVFGEAANSWSAKDLAIFFASSLAIEGEHVDAQRGATQRLGTLFPFDEFLRRIVWPELASPVSARSPPIIKADCIRVVASFRAHIDLALVPEALDFLSVWLGSEDYVVMTYAAHALERLLLVQRPAHHYLVTEEMFAPYVGRALQNLCMAIQKTDLQPHNAYLAKCIMRMCVRLPLGVTPYVGDLVMSLSTVLTTAARNPTNPLFSYCLFDIFSRCIALSPDNSASIEQVLWGNLVYILAHDVLEYVPYALQILAQLLRTHCAHRHRQQQHHDHHHPHHNGDGHSNHGHSTGAANHSSHIIAPGGHPSSNKGAAGHCGGSLASSPHPNASHHPSDALRSNGSHNEGAAGVHDSSDSAVPPTQYQALLAPLLEPGIYEQRGNIPAIICLLSAFVECYPSYVHSQGATNKLLNIFSYLVKLKNFDHQGLTLLTTMLLNYPASIMDEYMTAILKLLIERLQNARTPKYVRIVILFFSVLVIVRGPDDLVRRLDTVQNGLFLMMFNRVWIPNVAKITGDVERKTCIVALAQLLYQSGELQNSDGGNHWAQAVRTCLHMMHSTAEQDDTTAFVPHTHTLQDLAKLHTAQLEESGFTNSYCPLPEAQVRPRDVCAEVQNPEMYFRERVREVLQGRGASLMRLLYTSLTPDLLALVQ